MSRSRRLGERGGEIGRRARGHSWGCWSGQARHPDVHTMKRSFLSSLAVSLSVMAALLLTSCASPAKRYLAIRKKQTDPKHSEGR